MRIPEHKRITLASLVEPLDTPERREDYRNGRFPRADRVKDLDKRYRWDLFWSATTETPGFVESLYEFGDDRHIDTALRAIVGPL